ncbi:hypothetical protein GCM10008986_20650 [Salinibacillus aidingensis]|uniref:DUF4362 domain-containing protein n=1 Tax=Salinibacillus aidingensis TaxID=237684 RepID=A0ABN1BB28_9BACI
MRPTKILFVLIIIVLMAGCQNTENLPNTNQKEDNIPNYNPSSEDIVDMHGDIENIDRFKKFINNVEAGQKDSIRVIRYTTEGDPVLRNLEYDGEAIISTSDTRRDKYGKGSINTATCESIEVNETTERTDYLLDDCENIIDHTILVIWK